MRFSDLCFFFCISLLFFSCKQVSEHSHFFLHLADWGREAALSQVESVCFDSASDLYYVSNGKSYQKGVEGYISRFSAKGELLEAKWIDSLHRPTGMAVKQDILYIADVNRLLAIDTKAGKIIQSYPSPISDLGLNDVAISAEGEVFVSASFVHAIMKLEGDSLTVWMQDEKSLEYANGLCITGNKLWVAGMKLTQLMLDSQKMKEIKLPDGIQDFDGVFVGPKEELLLSTVENSSLWYIDESGESEKLIAGKGYYLGDFHYDGNKNLLIPRGSHEKTEYFISAFQFLP
ncbi:MAG: hypothetical protein R8P61_33815 [Bacteroidia bacterium]|nr:hypothetical protein [Bacteroidia bacterium]